MCESNTADNYIHPCRTIITCKCLLGWTTGDHVNCWKILTGVSNKSQQFYAGCIPINGHLFPETVQRMLFSFLEWKHLSLCLCVSLLNWCKVLREQYIKVLKIFPACTVSHISSQFFGADTELCRLVCQTPAVANSIGNSVCELLNFMNCTQI